MIVLDCSQLSDKELTAIDAQIPAPPVTDPPTARESAAQFLARIGAGQSAVDYYVQQLDAAHRAAAVTALEGAGVPSDQVLFLAKAFAQAAPDVQADVVKMLSNAAAPKQ